MTMTPMIAYLGDSVYARFDGCAVILYLDNGDGPKHTIYLEREVLDALLEFKRSAFNEEPKP